MNKRYQEDLSLKTEETSRRQILQVIRDAEVSGENAGEGDYFEKLERAEEEKRKQEMAAKQQAKPKTLMEQFEKVQQESLVALREYESLDWVVEKQSDLVKAQEEGRILVGVTTTKRKKYVAKVYVEILKKSVKIGTYETREEAAFFHDLAAVQIYGIKAKTNYIYSKEALQMLVEDQRVPHMLDAKYAHPDY